MKEGDNMYKIYYVTAMYSKWGDWMGETTGHKLVKNMDEFTAWFQTCNLLEDKDGDHEEIIIKGIEKESD